MTNLISKDGTTVKEIVSEWLSENGYDGLFSPDGGCGCDLNDLFCCMGEGCENCICAYKGEPPVDEDGDYWMYVNESDAR